MKGSLRPTYLMSHARTSTTIYRTTRENPVICGNSPVQLHCRGERDLMCVSRRTGEWREQRKGRGRRSGEYVHGAGTSGYFSFLFFPFLSTISVHFSRLPPNHRVNGQAKSDWHFGSVAMSLYVGSQKFQPSHPAPTTDDDDQCSPSPVSKGRHEVVLASKRITRKE